MTTKKCFRCKRIKVLSSFYVHPEMADGHLNKCKACTKKDVQKRYDDPDNKERIRQYERERNRGVTRKKLKLIYQQRRREKSRGKYRANMRVAHSIRDGRITRKPCEVCGDPKSEAHHDDYRKYLDVKWLCFKHHRELHKTIK